MGAAVPLEVVGRLGRVAFTRLEPGADLYQEIVNTVKRNEMRTAVVLSLTGALEHTRLSMPVSAEGLDRLPRIFERAGTAEVHGTGVVGVSYDEWEAPAAGVHYPAGDPYLHVHVSVGIGGDSYCGHLIEGCRVRSMHSVSHFTMAIAEVEGVELGMRVEREGAPADYTGGMGYHVLTSRPLSD
jgi:predicted DNA-binding protein with PD1-like motif